MTNISIAFLNVLVVALLLTAFFLGLEAYSNFTEFLNNTALQEVNYNAVP